MSFFNSTRKHKVEQRSFVIRAMKLGKQCASHNRLRNLGLSLKKEKLQKSKENCLKFLNFLSIFHRKN